MENVSKKILLTGGGTAGSVSPLLAIASDLKSEGFEFLFVGTKNGVERQMVKEVGINYEAILAGKLRRYFDWQNLLDIFRITFGFWQALFLIIKYKPDLIMSAGSFVSVPIVWAGWILGVPVMVHQQDVRSGLANKVMAPFAKIITVTFEKSLTDYGAKAIWTGNPVRQISNIKYPISNNIFNLKEGFPTVFIYGGGTGAEGINKLVEAGFDNLMAFCQIIHSTGKGKANPKRHANYHQYEFLNKEQMSVALNTADLIVSRAGLGAITEIVAAAKPAIIIPMPDSHQEDNAAILVEKNAAIVLNQNNLSVDEFVVVIQEALKNPSRRFELSKNISQIMKPEANEEMKKIVKNLFEK